MFISGIALKKIKLMRESDTDIHTCEQMNGCGCDADESCNFL